MRFIKIFVLIILLGGCWRLKTKNIAESKEADIDFRFKDMNAIDLSHRALADLRMDLRLSLKSMKDDIDLRLKGIKPIPASLLEKYVDRLGPPGRVSKVSENPNEFWVVVVWWDSWGGPILLAWMSYDKKTQKWTVEEVTGKGAFIIKEEKSYPLPPLRKPLRPLPSPHFPDYLKQMIRFLKKGKVA